MTLANFDDNTDLTKLAKIIFRRRRVGLEEFDVGAIVEEGARYYARLWENGRGNNRNVADRR